MSIIKICLSDIRKRLNGKQAMLLYPIILTAFLFCLSLCLSVCPCSHPTLLVTLAATYTLHRLGKKTQDSI